MAKATKDLKWVYERFQEDHEVFPTYSITDEEGYYIGTVNLGDIADEICEAHNKTIQE